MKNCNFCCESMEQNITETQSVIYNSVFDEYGIPCKEDGGLSLLMFEFCPWCGKKLPNSQRDKWFEELEKKGFYNPFDEPIPEEFKTSLWRHRV